VATYTELYDLHADSALRNRIIVACLVQANTIRGESGATANHANRLIWAAKVFADPSTEATRMFWAVLAVNKDATTAQITGATDVAVQSAVAAVVDLFATGA
jgi:hypothetical protein